MTGLNLVIAVASPASPEVHELLARHLAVARRVTPLDHVHALDEAAVDDPALTFFAGREHGDLVGVAALRHLSDAHGELKSMHTSETARGRGIGEAMVRHILAVASGRGYERVSLETGTADVFAPARRLYERVGFRRCEPFGDYTANPYSTCMRITLNAHEASGPPPAGAQREPVSRRAPRLDPPL